MGGIGCHPPIVEHASTTTHASKAEHHGREHSRHVSSFHRLIGNVRGLFGDSVAHSLEGAAEEMNEHAAECGYHLRAVIGERDEQLREYDRQMAELSQSFTRDHDAMVRDLAAARGVLRVAADAERARFKRNPRRDGLPRWLLDADKMGFLVDPAEPF